MCVDDCGDGASGKGGGRRRLGVCVCAVVCIAVVVCVGIVVAECVVVCEGCIVVVVVVMIIIMDRCNVVIGVIIIRCFSVVGNINVGEIMVIGVNINRMIVIRVIKAYNCVSTLTMSATNCKGSHIRNEFIRRG